MACIILSSPHGTRYIPENTEYQLLQEESIVGVDWNCGHVIQDDVEAHLQEAGLKLGDAIAWVTHKLGIPQCAPCKARQEILNNAQKLGWKETIRQLKETLKRS
jgi:hypothetical protein